MPRFLLFVFAAACSNGTLSAGSTESLERQTVFRAREEGYHCYRIPALVRARSGTILAFCEARKNNCRDHGDIDVVLRRSNDGGRTWSAMEIVADAGPFTIGNACPVVDQSNGTIWLPLCRQNQTILLSKSTDEGVTWSQPTDITASAKDPRWHWVGTGPGHGIQLDSGRLLIPSWADAKPRLGEVQLSYAFFSDDHGQTWRSGNALDLDTSDECEAVELLDGSLYMFARSRQGKKQRAWAISENGGVSWSSVRNDPQLPEPSVMGSVIRVTDRRTHERNRIILACPAEQSARRRLTVYLSYDECRSWPRSKVIHQGSAAYSDLCVADDHTVLLAYEADDYSRIAIDRFNIEWLTGGKDRLQTKNSQSDGFVAQHLKTINELSAQGATSAVRASRDALAVDGVDILKPLLTAMGKAEIVAANWYRSIYEEIVARELQMPTPRFPLNVLRAHVQDHTVQGRSRRLVLNLLERIVPGTRNETLIQMLDDAEFRREAVELTIAAGDRAKEAGQTGQAKAKYSLAFSKARDRDHWSQAADRLKSIGEKVSIIDQMGYVVRWHVIGPFAAPGTTGFDRVYPPENGVDLNATYHGQNGRKIKWTTYETPDRFGQLNLIQGIASCEEAVGYAYAELDSPEEKSVQMRCGADDNCQIWVNGERVLAPRQWLNGIRPDRFTATVRLRKGKNRVLAKICQGPHHKNPAVGNNWSFQLRFCDESGLGVGLVNTVPQSETK